VGGTFVGGLVLSLTLLAGIASLLLTALRAAVKRFRRMPVTLRHAVANLYRPGSQSRAVLTALGTGVMFTLTIYLVQSSVLDEIRRSAPPGMANVFFLDITQGQKDELAKLVASQPGLERPLDVIATVSCRLESVNGVSVSQMKISPGAKRRYQMARNVSAEAAKPAGVEVVKGAWWKPGDGASVSITQNTARSLGVDVGATMTWLAYGRRIDTRVASVHRTEQQRLRGMLEFHMNSEALGSLPTVYYAGGRVASPYIGRLQRAVYERFPTVTVINVADVLDRVQEVVDQIALIIRFLSGFAIFAGVVILASSVAGTRFRRVREMAVFKTLGATRRRMIAMFSAEFLIIGAAAGLTGSLLASGFTYIVLRRFFDDAPFQFDLTAVVVSALATAVLASAAGWIASFRILGQKPLEVLRGE
jgi:putative ABC transport system permease protein